ncbi:uncharacterized protein BJ212DRAFT_1489216 [Suillus subaureus]|uniref:Uncharacterized protein n=1 Tax=Suillus subaureus TaxID=48587 RepID=A0A9P7DK52_9AGAM|nr:uncharacterized protein BJ212DRAFT_1489216 [Suillus subaureus]KAG1796836.1 hypothetical protein BJ212DRAFT_1489216 [Suillus subaureus]
MAQYKVEKPQSKLALDEVKPPFAHAADIELNPCDVPVDAVLIHMTSGGSVPHGYSTDDSGNLLACNKAESYNQELAASATEGDEEIFGCGKVVYLHLLLHQTLSDVAPIPSGPPDLLSSVPLDVLSLIPPGILSFGRPALRTFERPTLCTFRHPTLHTFRHSILHTSMSCPPDLWTPRHPVLSTRVASLWKSSGLHQTIIGLPLK